MATNDFIKYAFISGEISPTLYGRSDLEKYDLGLALAQNVFIDYRGGLSNRAGTQFVDYVMHDDKPTKFFKFKFAPDVVDTYIMLFGHNYIRFIQSGAYILEDDVVVTGVTNASPAVVTAVAHGYSNGDWVKLFDVGGMDELQGRTFQVANVATDTFELQDPFEAAFDTTSLGTYVGGGVVARIYTVPTTYAASDLYILRCYQLRNLVRITHPNYQTANLIRSGETNWALTPVVFGNKVSTPTGLVATPSSSGSAGMSWAVTAVDAAGEESLASPYLIVSDSVNYATTAGSLRLTWSPVTGAQFYNVYRSNILPTGAQASRGQLVGFVGSSFGPEFIDNNITPDFTVTPPERYNPFANGAVRFITVTAGGTGYTATSTVSVAGGGGTGFVGYPVVNASGAVIAVVVVNGGEGYSDVTVTFSGGTGATATADIGPATGNFPSVATVFQQRQVYAATLNQPLTVFGSRSGRLLDNFDGSRIVVDSDSYEYDIDSEDAAPIRHVVAMRAGLLVISQSGVWQLTGGQEQAVTPLNALADPQSYTGCALVPPIKVDTDLLYIEGKGSTVRLLSYNDFSKVYGGQDMSILSNHFFTPTKQITHWDYAQEPFKLAWARRSDGKLLSFTIVKEQNVYAWAQHQTKGLVDDVVCLQEGVLDKTYIMVSRYLNGRWTKCIELFAEREFDTIEAAWFVDCGLSLPENKPAATLTVAANKGQGVSFTASSAVFDAGDAGNVVYIGGGSAVVTEFVSSTEVLCDIIRPISAVLPESEEATPLPASAGSWIYNKPVSVIGGLWHLEGQKVSILADGHALAQQVVTDGKVNLGQDYSRAIVGLPFTARAKTLPPVAPDAIVEGRVKRPVGVTSRVADTRGLRIGETFDQMYEIKDRTSEAYGEPTRLIQGTEYMLLDASFTIDAAVCYEQTYPLPMTLLAVVLDTEVGDDKN